MNSMKFRAFPIVHLASLRRCMYTTYLSQPTTRVKVTQLVLLLSLSTQLPFISSLFLFLLLPILLAILLRLLFYLLLRKILLLHILFFLKIRFCLLTQLLDFAQS